MRHKVKGREIRRSLPGIFGGICIHLHSECYMLCQKQSKRTQMKTLQQSRFSGMFVWQQAKPRIWVQLTTSTQGLKQRLRQQKCFYIPLLMFGHLKPKNLGFKQGELDTAHQTNTTTAYEHVARQTSRCEHITPDINVSFPTADVVSQHQLQASTLTNNKRC